MENQIPIVDERTKKLGMYGGGLVVVLTLLAPIGLPSEPAAQVLFNVVLAIATTLVSVAVTYRVAKAASRDELARYALQAWRNLQALELKVRNRAESEVEVDASLLQDWLLDIDMAKQGWRDLVQEAFVLQARLEAESHELTEDFKRRISATADESEIARLQAEQVVELAKRAAKAPLPLRVTEPVECPTCSAMTHASLGLSAGETRVVECTSCGDRFNVHRTGSGDARVGGKIPERAAGQAAETRVLCPQCSEALVLFLPKPGGTFRFWEECPHCNTHFQFAGSHASHHLSDLGVSNSIVACPNCEEAMDVWSAPGSLARFVSQCEQCDRMLLVSGPEGSLSAVPVDSTTGTADGSRPYGLLVAAASHALGAGRISFSRKCYSAAAALGLPSQYVASNESILCFAEGDFDASAAALRKAQGLSSQNNSAKCHYLFMGALLKANGDEEQDLDGLVEQLRRFPRVFARNSTAVWRLESMLRASDRLTDPLRRVFDEVRELTVY